MLVKCSACGKVFDSKWNTQTCSDRCIQLNKEARQMGYRDHMELSNTWQLAIAPFKNVIWSKQTGKRLRIYAKI